MFQERINTFKRISPNLIWLAAAELTPEVTNLLAVRGWCGGAIDELGQYFYK